MKTIKDALTTLSVTLLTVALSVSAFTSVAEAALTMAAAEEAAAKAGFTEVSKRKPKDPFYGSKRADAKTWMTLEAFPKGQMSTQVAISCNQCKSRKMPDALVNTCLEEVQKLATSLKVDLPGGVIKAFEHKTPEENWELKDQEAKRLRFQRTSLKCDSGPSGSGIRFDFFY